MTWQKIIGQNRTKKILQRAFVEKRIPHAYCFWGLEGIGKDALAIEFAKLINCKNPVINGDSAEACDNCSSCRQANALSHPNIQLVFSMPSGVATTRNDNLLDKLTDEQINQIKEQISIKARNPYHRLSISNANQIRIASVRDIKKNLNLSQSQGGRRCIIIFRADEMTAESANAFLKALEEPTENTTIILTTNRHETILPTILSRCQQIRCEPLSDEEIMQVLIDKHEISQEKAKIVSVFAQGSYSKALEFLDEDMKDLREFAVDILRTALKKKGYRLDLASKIEELTKSKDKKKHEIFLTLLIIWLRDAVSLANGNKTNIVNIDQLETIEKFAVNFGSKRIDLAIQAIEDAVTQIKRNVIPSLIYLNLFVKIREYFF